MGRSQRCCIGDDCVGGTNVEAFVRWLSVVQVVTALEDAHAPAGYKEFACN